MQLSGKGECPVDESNENEDVDDGRYSSRYNEQGGGLSVESERNDVSVLEGE